VDIFSRLIAQMKADSSRQVGEGEMLVAWDSRHAVLAPLKQTSAMHCAELVPCWCGAEARGSAPDPTTNRAGHDALSNGCPLSRRVDLISRNSLDQEFDFVGRVCVDVSDPREILGSHRKIHDHVHRIFKTGRSLNL
jgi:hypothetical protein